MRLIRKFNHDARGSVLMLTGLAILILFAVAGAGVDFGRQQLVRMKLQNASDAAAVAAASMPEGTTVEQRRQVALRYYNLNYPASYLGVARPSPNIQIGNQITVDASATLATNFIANVGVDQLASQGRTVVERTEARNSVYDVLLVMDNSNSMAWETTAPAFAETPSSDRQNARNLILQTCRDQFRADAEQNIFCGTSPTASPSPRMANWFPSPTAYINQDTCTQEWPDEMCRNSMEDGVNPYNPLACTSGTPSTINQNCYGYGYGLTGNSRLNALRSVALGFVDRIVTEGEPGSRIGLVAWSSDLIFNQPLTDNTATLRQQINRMSAIGATNPVAGMQQATSMASTFDPTHVKAVVFLTDGAPTLAGPRLNPNSPNDNHGCNGRNFCNPAISLTSPLCTQLKNSGVQVYTIGFLGFDTTGANRTNSVSFLRNCASVDADNNPRYYEAPTGEELDQAFTQILTSLGRIRIAQ